MKSENYLFLEYVLALESWNFYNFQSRTKMQFFEAFQQVKHLKKNFFQASIVFPLTFKNTMFSWKALLTEQQQKSIQGDLFIFRRLLILL